MKKNDLIYLCRNLADISGIPVRLYQNGELVFSRQPIALPADPVTLCIEEIFRLEGHISYWFTPEFHLYGMVKSREECVVMGPTSQFSVPEHILRKLAFDLDVPKERQKEFAEGMKGISRMSFDTLISILCSLNLVLNNERLELRDIMISPEHQEALKRHTETRRTEAMYQRDREEILHNTLHLEQTLMRIVEKGDLSSLKEWIRQVPPVKSGILAEEDLRQAKNTFIVTATLVSRAAIRGGMDPDDALSLSDGYIQRAEVQSGLENILNLQYHMITEFTEQTARLSSEGISSKLAAEVTNYIRHHISERISTEKLAGHFFLSRTYFSSRFKEETGMTLRDFILKEKTEEAKRLLRYSDQHASAIGDYLGFSSPGHFSRVFRKYAGMTPNEYREKNR